MLLRGVDIQALPLRRILSLVEQRIYETASDEKELNKLKRRLYDPPPELAKAKPEAVKRAKARTAMPQQSMADLLALAAAQDSAMGG